jgi:hypothetical protein
MLLDECNFQGMRFHGHSISQLRSVKWMNFLSLVASMFG